LDRSLRCPYCGARFSVREETAIAVCPYCGTALWPANGKEVNEHYIYEDQLGLRGAQNAVKEEARRLYSAPEDLGEIMTARSGFLHYVPLHLYHVRVKAGCPHSEAAILEEEYKTVLASKFPRLNIPESYTFPVRGWREFQPKILERGMYYHVGTRPEALKSRASERARRRVALHASSICEEPRVEDETHWDGIIHYPFWEINYNYKGRLYKGLVDAAGGDVVYIEYPTIEGRHSLLGLSTGVLISGLLLGGSVGVFIGQPLAGALGGLTATLPLAYPLARNRKRSTRIYMINPGSSSEAPTGVEAKG